MSPTIKDIAKAAGVSITTVSRALNGYPDVNEKTRSRIKKLAEKMSYRPNAQAQSLVLKKTNTIGVIISELTRDSVKAAFSFEVLCGISDRSSELNYDIILFSTNPNKQMNKTYSDLCRERNVDGVILKGLKTTDPYLREVTDQSMFPSVLIDIPVAGERVGHVTTDNVSGVRDAVRHLIQLGHRNIAFINGYKEAAICADRLSGYMLGLQEADITYDVSKVEDGRFSEEGGAEAIGKILSRHPETTAVVCSSDIMALGVMKELEQMGRVIPDCISVIGFDDISIASYSTPKLTTVRQEKYEMGYQAAQMLIDMIEGRKVKHKIVLENRLIIRESTDRLQKG